MSPDAPSQKRLSVIWAPEARGALRAINRTTALDILHCLDRHLIHRNGDVKRLRPPLTGFPLRCGEYRLFFDVPDEAAIEITGVRHRREAYR